jgi:hypothetical protein
LNHKIVNIANFLKNIPLFKGNPLSVNILIFLLIAGYFIVSHELVREMTDGKNELGYLTTTLKKSIKTDNSNILRLFETVPPFIRIILTISPRIQSSDFELFPPGRSPPNV